jgi:hypothetical protein
VLINNKELKIKSSEQSFFLSYIIGALVLIGVIVLLSADFNGKALPKIVPSKAALPDSVRVFLKQSSSLEEVLHYFEKEEIFIGIKDDASNKFPKAIRNKMKGLGGKKLSKICFRDAYAGYFYNGEIIEEKRSDDTALELKIGNNILSSAGMDYGNFCHLSINGVKYEGEKRGLHLFIKSRYERAVFQYDFDFFDNENAVSKGTFGEKKHPDLEQIELFLKEKAFQKISKKREEALDLNLLMASDEDLVNGEILYDGKSYKVETRLKGDWTDHLFGDKWSFRIKLKDEETVMGMKKFSLHHPRTRNYAGEWLFHELLKGKDILHLQYKFVEFWLNKTENGVFERKNLGIYAVEESFEKQLFERQKRRAGLIIKLDESVFWEERLEFVKGGLIDGDLSYIELTAFKDFNIVPFSQKTVIKDPVLREQFSVARYLLKSYMMGDRKATEVFDVEKLVDFNVICNLLGTYHALVPHNWRLYYNPITSRLEPIGFDANGVEKAWKLNVFEWAQNDLDYLRLYNRKIQELIENETYKTLSDYPGLESQIALLQAEFKDFQWNERILYHNNSVMKNAVLPIKSINVFLEKMEDEKAIFTIENFGSMPVELMDIRHTDNRIFGAPNQENILLAGEKKQVTYRLNNNFEKLFVNKKKKKSNFALYEDMEKVRLTWQTIGTTLIRKAEIQPWREEDTALKASFFERRAPKEVPDMPFLEVDETRKIIKFKSGVWELRKTVKLPAGYTVKMSSGCHIELASAYGQIISYSPIHFIGTKEDPVTIVSDTGFGGGIFVMGSADTSIVRHCVFDNLGIPKQTGWALSGAVNFFENPVKISNAVFKNNRTEDGLNIINSWFEIDNVVFANTQSDAFDGDFVTGTISNTSFINLGNDAIDISGSKLTVKKVIIQKAGDKGLSAGENSQMTAEDVLIQDCEVAIASKDLSQMTANQVVLRNNRLGFTAFQKKPEFGACQIEATNIRLENNELDYLIERNSSLKLNGKFVPVSDGVKERMYGAEFGKSSK